MKQYDQLSQKERHYIAYLSRRRYKPAQIARELGRHRRPLGAIFNGTSGYMTTGIAQNRLKAIIKAVESVPVMDFTIQRHKYGMS